MTEWVKGKTVDEAMQIKNTDIAQELSLPPVKIHCSVLAEDAIKAAVTDWQRKQQARAPTPGPEGVARVGALGWEGGATWRRSRSARRRRSGSAP